MLLGLAAALVAAVFYGVASILQAVGARRAASPDGPAGGLRPHPEPGLDPGIVVRLLRQPAYLTALGMTLLGFVFHLIAVRLLPLFLAQMGIAVSLVVTALLAVRIFGDHLSRLDWVAIGAVFVGLIVLASAAGDSADTAAPGWLPVSLFAVLAAMVVFGLLLSRTGGVAGSAGLGLLGGLGYAVVGVSARILPDFTTGHLLTSPATYSLGLGGTLAFFLYSLALQRGSVTAATTAVISTQTVTPAVVGVVLLGDTVRDGWWPVAIAGFLLTAAAATALVRFEGVRESSLNLDEDRAAGRGEGRSGEGPADSPARDQSV